MGRRIHGESAAAELIEARNLRETRAAKIVGAARTGRANASKVMASAEHDYLEALGRPTEALEHARAAPAARAEAEVQRRIASELGALQIQLDSAQLTASAPAGIRIGLDGSFTARHTASATSDACVIGPGSPKRAKTLFTRSA